ncbi:hypothetical protein ID866_13272 [Astraeus odoratus]|nr:hypothetical protein ID866_13272 [Astraeus odoratus]
MMSNSCGTNNGPKGLPLSQRISEQPLNKLDSIPLIQRLLLTASCPHQDVLSSLHCNGFILSNGNMSTLLKCSNVLTPPKLIQNKPTSLTTRLSCPSVSPNQSPVLEMLLNITLPSPCLSRPSPLSSLKGGMNTLSTKLPLDDSSMPLSQHIMGKSLTMTMPFETGSQSSGTFASLIPPLLTTSEQLSYPHSVLVPIPPNPEVSQRAPLSLEELDSGVIPVINGIGVSAPRLKLSVSMHTAVTAKDAKVCTEGLNVLGKRKGSNEFIARHQQFRRNFVWGGEESAVS